MPNSCPINVGERLRTIAAVPLIKNRDIQRNCLRLQTTNLGSGVRISPGAPAISMTWSCLLCPDGEFVPALDHGQILAAPIRCILVAQLVSPTAREMIRGIGRSAPARDHSWNGACCPIHPNRHPGVADQNLGLRARTSFWSPLRDSHSSMPRGCSSRKATIQMRC